jgi:hypothetical protein
MEHKNKRWRTADVKQALDTTVRAIAQQAGAKFVWAKLHTDAMLSIFEYLTVRDVVRLRKTMALFVALQTVRLPHVSITTGDLDALWFSARHTKEDAQKLFVKSAQIWAKHTRRLDVVFIDDVLFWLNTSILAAEQQPVCSIFPQLEHLHVDSQWNGLTAAIWKNLLQWCPKLCRVHAGIVSGRMLPTDWINEPYRPFKELSVNVATADAISCSPDVVIANFCNPLLERFVWLSMMGMHDTLWTLSHTEQFVQKTSRQMTALSISNRLESKSSAASIQLFAENLPDLKAMPFWFARIPSDLLGNLYARTRWFQDFPPFNVEPPADEKKSVDVAVLCKPRVPMSFLHLHREGGNDATYWQHWTTSDVRRLITTAGRTCYRININWPCHEGDNEEAVDDATLRKLVDKNTQLKELTVAFADTITASALSHLVQQAKRLRTVALGTYDDSDWTKAPDVDIALLRAMANLPFISKASLVHVVLTAVTVDELLLLARESSDKMQWELCVPEKVALRLTEEDDTEDLWRIWETDDEREVVVIRNSPFCD